MVATLEPRNEASGDVFELGVAESTVIEDYNGLELVVWTVRDCHDDGRIKLTRGGGSTAQGRPRPDRQLKAVEVDMGFHQGLLAPFSPQLGELTLMYSRSSDGEKLTPRIVQVIDYGESASQPLLHADDHVSVWNPLGHNGHGSEYGLSAWRLAPLRLPARTRVIALVPANGPDGGGPLMAVVAMLATWCDAQLHLSQSRTGAFRIQVRPIFNGQPSAHVVSVKWTHVRLIDMAVTTYCSLPPMETSRPAYAVNPRDLRSWAQPLVYFCTDYSMHSYPQAVRPLRSCSSKLAFSKRSLNASKLACGNGGSADLCGDGTALVAGLPFSRHGVRVTTVRDSCSTSSAVTHAGARGKKGVLTALDGTSVFTDLRTASCSPSSSSCHSTTRLSGDGSAFVPHDSAGTGTGDGDSTVLNGGDGVAEQCSASCNNIREASVLGSDGSACVRHESAGTGDGVPTVLNCVRHESAGTGDGDSTVLNGGDGVAEQCSTSCNNICEASVLSSDGSTCARHESAGTGDGDPAVLSGGDGVAEQCSASCNNICETAALSSDGSTSVPRSLEGSDVDLAPAPCDVMPAATTHSVCTGSKSSAGASNTAGTEERALRKQVARLKQDAAVLRERLAGLESRRKESAVPADAHAAPCCSGQQSTSFRATLQAIVELCQQLLADAADPTSKVVLLSSALADGSSGVTAPACGSSGSNSTVCGGAKPSTINSEHCNTGARTAAGNSGHDIRGSCTGVKLVIKASVATSVRRKAAAPHRRTAAGASVNMAQQTVAAQASSRKPAATAGSMHADDMLPAAVAPPLTAKHTGAITHNATATAPVAPHVALRYGSLIHNQGPCGRLSRRLGLSVSMELSVHRLQHAVRPGQQPTAFRAALQAIVELCQQLLADAADPTSKVVLLSSALADGSSGVTAPACGSSGSNSTVCGGAKPSTINSEHCNTGARTAAGNNGYDIRGSCTGGKSVIKASVATSCGEQRLLLIAALQLVLASTWLSKR
ncbi:hypothetical protein JKP88DRAFT_245854 [Tribonema minus]|uniref:Uncharacterized protein n=1 Tax=Tribonema minus TaxID=303371 RepID=A0A836CE90_9STRA|nr:hypothetical protein JKP88DRAFT_245854 [Tribonema minus]